jgi:hypothetical protein
MAYIAANRVLAGLANKSIARRQQVSIQARSRDGRHTAITKQRVGKTIAAWHQLSLAEQQAYREAKALKRSRWLTNAIVIKEGRQVFDVTVPHDDGTPSRILITLPGTATPLQFLQAVMRCPAAPLIMRMEAAKYAAVFMHERKTAIRVTP